MRTPSTCKPCWEREPGVREARRIVLRPGFIPQRDMRSMRKAPGIPAITEVTALAPRELNLSIAVNAEERRLRILIFSSVALRDLTEPLLCQTRPANKRPTENHDHSPRTRHHRLLHR